MYQLTIEAFHQICKLLDVLYNFLFQEIKILDYTFSMWQLLAGVLFTTFLVMWLVKKLVPVT